MTLNTETVDDDRAPTPGEAPHAPLSPAGILLYCMANLGYGMFYAFNNFALPLWLRRFTHDARLIGLLAGTHSYEGIVFQPLTGLISDRIRSPLGKRRPIMLIALPICCVLLGLTPLAATLPAHRLTAIVICIVLFTCTFNIASDPYQALLVDTTRPDQRGFVTGLWYVFSAGGQVGILLTNLHIETKCLLVAAVMLVTGLITIAGTRERPWKAEERDTKARVTLARTLSGLSTLKQARLYMLMYLCYGAGTDAIIPNLTNFVEQITHCPDSTAQSLMIVLMLAVTAATLPMGFLTDRIGPKRLLQAGLLLVGIASLAGLWVHTLAQIRVVLLLAGIGTAAQNASSYPLLARLVPAKEMGFYTGVQSAALALAGPTSLVFTGTLINHGGYRMIFWVSAVCIALGMAFLAPVKVHKARVEIEAYS
ncbi:MAG: MFS transporter [Capsulimonadaceae bacterium]